MTKKAFVMQLRAGNEAEYERRHNSIWPELEATLRARHNRVLDLLRSQSG